MAKTIVCSEVFSCTIKRVGLELCTQHCQKWWDNEDEVQFILFYIQGFLNLLNLLTKQGSNHLPETFGELLGYSQQR